MTKSISRFGRNTVELLKTVRELKVLGIGVRFEKEGIDSLTSDGELLLTLLASMAQEESVSLSQNVKWKVKEQFKQGLPYIAQDIYGYRWNGEEYVIEPHEASIVRQVFEWYINGEGIPTIAKRLNKMGEKTRLGNCFTKSILYEFFKQEAYYGTLVLQKTYREDFCRNPKRNKGQRTRYIVENAHEPIITKELFEQVKCLKGERSKGRFYRKDYSDALFRDKVFCQHCGKDMLITKEKKYGYRYNCRTRQHYGKEACPSKTLSERRLIQTLENNLTVTSLQDWVGDCISKVEFNSYSYSVTVFNQAGEKKNFLLKKGQIK
ncbi:recombinase family protein [Streptococcus suis]